MRTLEWDSEKKGLRVIDQRALPAQLNFVVLKDYLQVSQAIRNMILRGAPVIGVAAAYGLLLSALNSTASDLTNLKLEIHEAAVVLLQSRPTAVNLHWAIQRMMQIVKDFKGNLDDLKVKMREEANAIAEEDIQTNLAIARNGAQLIYEGDTIIHHCNTGALATVDWGTALGVIRMAYEQGKHLHVLVDETRPRLQGSRLTAWELIQYQIPFEIITDNAAGFFLKKGIANKVLFGADRVARNGDVANKVGSYMLALAANANHVPVYCVFPTTSIDLSLENGDQIPIEERDADEVLDIQLHHEQVVPAGARARNPAFDITPHELISAYVTEVGVIRPPFAENLASAMKHLRS